MQKYLIVNTGSVSAKYSIYSQDKELFFGHYEVEAGQPVVTFFGDGRKGKGRTDNITQEVFNNSLDHFIEESIKAKIINNKEDIIAIGIRVVAPGKFFQTDRVVDEVFISQITDQKEEAPRHVPLTLEEITEIKEIFPTTKIVAISDSAYHKDKPDFSKYYAIPKKVSDDLDLMSFGYHGISLGSIVAKLAEEGRVPSKLVVCHLGGGSSILAIKDGKSFNTSMGFTPMQGVVMSTRVGDIDPVAVMYLGQKLNKNITELEAYFNNECGLLGLSGKSSDVRDLLLLEEQGNNDAKLALEKLVMSIKKYIGGFSAEMGGLDEMVFTGTIGERSYPMRERICKNMEYLGVKINYKKNKKLFGVDGVISSIFSKVKVRIICTNEMDDMAKRLINFN